MLRNLVFVASITLISTAAFAETPQYGTAEEARAMLDGVVAAVKADKTKALTREATTAPSAESGPAQAAASQAATSGDFAGLVDIGGRRLCALRVWTRRPRRQDHAIRVPGARLGDGQRQGARAGLDCVIPFPLLVSEFAGFARIWFAATHGNTS
jgi:hypothetical protein